MSSYKNVNKRKKLAPLFRLNLLVVLYESIRSRDEVDCGLRRREELSHEDILHPQNLNTETVTSHNYIVSLIFSSTSDASWLYNSVTLKAYKYQFDDVLDCDAMWTQVDTGTSLKHWHLPMSKHSTTTCKNITFTTTRTSNLKHQTAYFRELSNIWQVCGLILQELNK